MFSLINKKVIGVWSSEVKSIKPRMEKSEVIQKKKSYDVCVFSDVKMSNASLEYKTFLFIFLFFFFFSITKANEKKACPVPCIREQQRRRSKYTPFFIANKGLSLKHLLNSPENINE